MSFFNVSKKIKEIKTTLNESSDFAYRFFKKDGQVVGMVYLKALLTKIYYQVLFISHCKHSMINYQ